MTIATSRRLGGLGLAVSLLVAACGGGGGAASASQAPASGGVTGSAAGQAAIDPGDATGSGTGLVDPGAADVKLQGAGATFPAPLYQVWFEVFSGTYPNVQFDYQSIGSGGGIKAITEQTVDFGASDAAMTDAELANLPGGATILHVPTALGAVVVIFNVPGVTDINLDADTIAGIFLGTITKWSDPAIAALNSGVTLPDTAITVVHRSDGSGTTNAFTTYLDAVSPTWHDKVGAGKEVSWPTGIGAQGNDGVAGSVKQTEGAAGYVELTYAAQAGLTSAKVKNADGQYVAGSTDGVTAAANATIADVPVDFRQPPIINGPGADTYPIAAYTYLLVPQDWADADKAKAMVSFAAWALTDGQSVESSLGYAPLPASIAEKALASLHQITTGGSPVWP